jgi:MFS family permease
MDLSRNISLISIRSLFAMFLVTMPIIVPYWRSLGLSMHEILEIQAIFGLAVAVLEVPTGYIADLFGRKLSVVLGSFISGVGFTILLFADSYWSLVVFEVVLALACTLVSGAEDAILFESIPKGVSRKKVIGSFRSLGLIGEVLASLLAGILVVYSFQAVLWAQVGASWIPFFISLFLVEPPRAPVKRGSHISEIREVLAKIILREPLTRLVFINFVVAGLSSFCVVWLLQEFWRQSQVPVSDFGVMWAALMLVSVVMSRRAHSIEALIGAHRTLLLIALAPIAGYLLMAFAPPIVGIVAGGLFYVTRGLTYVIYQDAFNWRVPSQYRATANSFVSLFFRLGFVPIGPLLGSVVDHQGMQTGLAMLALGFSVTLVTILLPLVRRIDDLHVEYIPEAQAAEAQAAEA